ncbi:hypothetical protein [Caballeronia glathei]|uniref:Uncharacterized protein n=1 Tax=Caballeronia glathei TaxID=60547 RepID=A0A069PDD7_9BURK|nr:hypothetical protein [Caballeronia glathei]KDR37819.1 hypothetical protein BG61_06880 [Caballeronia glathei]
MNNVRSAVTVFHLRFVCITDLDEGGISATNDVERVLASLVQMEELCSGDIVIYQDREGWWDQIVIDHECRFVAWKSLNERTPQAAMVRILNDVTRSAS